MGLNNPSSSPTGSYAQGFFSSVSTYAVTSTTFADFTVTGTPVFTVRKSSGITLTGSSTLPAITFTPASTTSVYLISVSLPVQQGSGSQLSLQLTDGTTVITTGGHGDSINGAVVPFTLTGIYAPTSVSAQTIKVQGATPSGSVTISAESSVASVLEWTIVRLV